MKLCVISSSALPSPAPDMVYKPFMPSVVESVLKTFGVGTCIVCQKSFDKLSGIAKCCGRVCRLKYKRDVMHRWQKENKKYISDYMKRTKPHFDTLRRHRRLSIRQEWGIWQDWKQAELDALQILEQEGYTDIKHLSYLPCCPFDIIAFKDNQGYAFQVGTRTGIRKKRQHQFAKDLKFIHLAIFVSIEMKKYFIKHFSKGGNVELGMWEVKEARKYV